MSFLRPKTRKRFKFKVYLFVEELTSVTSVSGYWYCKLRFIHGTEIGHTKSVQVKDCTVSWRHRFEFSCKLTADQYTGELDFQGVRLSVRKEGRTDSKIGKVDLNLSEFAGSNSTQRHCLLEAYNERKRLDNSILKIQVGMQLLSGDPCYKVPKSIEQVIGLQQDSPPEGDIGDMADSDYVGSDSLSRTTPKHGRHDIGHTRNPSSISQRSDGYISKEHSRNTSSASSSIMETNSNPSTLNRSPKKISSRAPPRPPPPKTSELPLSHKVDNTRVDNDSLIDDILKHSNFDRDEKTDSAAGALMLYMDRNGKSVVLGSHATDLDMKPIMPK